MDDLIRAEARLVMLRELADQPNYSLSDALLSVVLETFGIARPRDWLREELRWLAGIGAIERVTAGSAVIATLTVKGRDHVEGRSLIEGVKRPGPRQ